MVQKWLLVPTWCSCFVMMVNHCILLAYVLKQSAIFFLVIFWHIKFVLEAFLFFDLILFLTNTFVWFWYLDATLYPQNSMFLYLWKVKCTRRMCKYALAVTYLTSILALVDSIDYWIQFICFGGTAILLLKKIKYCYAPNIL